MDEYQALYEEQFIRNLARYSSLRERIRKRRVQIKQGLIQAVARRERIDNYHSVLSICGGL